MSGRVRILLVLLGVTAVLGALAFFNREPSVPDAAADRTAAAFLAALDAGDLTALKANSLLTEAHLQYLIANRKSLGTRTRRQEVRREILRHGKKFGAYLEYESIYANAPRIREALTVMDKVAVARVYYAQLPRPLPAAYHPLPLPPEATRKIQMACVSYDMLNRNFFDGMSARDTGGAQRAVFNRIRNFHKRFGPAERRTALVEARYEKSVPGALGCSILRVVNKTVYTVRYDLYAGTEVIFLVRDNTEAKPQWDVYAFDPGTPKWLASTRKKAPRKPNAPAPKTKTP